MLTQDRVLGVVVFLCWQKYSFSQMATSFEQLFVFPKERALEGHHFLIDTYQRGYRWGKKEIGELLSDLDQFDYRSQGNYSLQPLIVKPGSGIETCIHISEMLQEEPLVKINEHYFELVDGQQRLTTIYLLLKNLGEKPPFELFYVYKRPIDETFIRQADEFINDKISGKDAIAKAELKEKISRHLLLLWYQLAEEEDSNQTFANINANRVPLTVSELAKALFFKDDASHAFAYQWKKMAEELGDDEFYYFLAPGKREEEIGKDADGLLAIYRRKRRSLEDEPRLDYLLNLFFRSRGRKDADNAFAYFEKEIESKGKEEAFDELAHFYDRLRSYYLNTYTFHLIGYLSCQGPNTLPSLLKATEGMDKKKQCQTIETAVRKTIDGLDLDNVDYAETGKSDIRNLLLLSNLYPYLGKESKDGRFSFASYKKEGWDIEHIDARGAEKYELNEEDKETFLSASKRNDEQKERLRQSDNFLRDYYRKEFGYEGEDLDVDSIENLVLLDEQTNRSYQNAPFFKKREVIIERIKNGQFVPPITQRVFLKFFSSPIDANPCLYQRGDADEYLKYLKEALKQWSR